MSQQDPWDTPDQAHPVSPSDCITVITLIVIGSLLVLLILLLLF